MEKQDRSAIIERLAHQLALQALGARRAAIAAAAQDREHEVVVVTVGCDSEGRPVPSYIGYRGDKAEQHEGFTVELTVAELLP